MKIAIVGSRNLNVNIEDYIPRKPDEIISGGARGIDRLAAEYAKKEGVMLTEILPDYKRYGRGAPLVRNRLIVDRADIVYIIFWDGKSAGSKYVIDYCELTKKEYHLFVFSEDRSQKKPSPV